MLRNPVEMGTRFGRLVVVGNAGEVRGSTGKLISTVIVKCDCGTTLTVREGNLRNRNILSCGCYRRERAGKLSWKHGKSRQPYRPNYLYSLWGAIKERTKYKYKDKNLAFPSEWENDFEAFEKYVVDTLGPRPEGFSLDRIDNKLGYMPGNLRWLHAKGQSNNRDCTPTATLKGTTKSLSEWSDIYGIAVPTIKNRLDHGWVVERALTEPTPSAETATYEGKTKSLVEWAKDLGIAYTTLFRRLESGWTLEEAFKTKAYGKSWKSEKITYKGEELTLKEAVSRTGFSENTIRMRFKKGWSPEDLMETPERKRKSDPTQVFPET